MSLVINWHGNYRGCRDVGVASGCKPLLTNQFCSITQCISCTVRTDIVRPGKEV